MGTEDETARAVLFVILFKAAVFLTDPKDD